MDKDLQFYLNMFFMFCIFICLTAFIYSWLVLGKEFPQMLNLIGQFGLPLGIGIAATKSLTKE